MYILLVNIDTLFRLIINGRICVAYSLIISIGLVDSVGRTFYAEFTK